MSNLLPLAAGLLVGSLAAVAALLPALRASRAIARLLSAELTSAKNERQALEAELVAAQERAELRKREIAAENAELRERMDELADVLMRERTGPPVGTAPDGREI